MKRIGISCITVLTLMTAAPAMASHFPGPGTVIDAVDASFGVGGGSFSGNLASGTWDWYTFFGQAGNAVQLNVDPSGASPMTDAALTLYAVIPNRAAMAGDVTADLVTLSDVLIQNDDANSTLFPQINFNLPNDGWYVAAVGGFGGNAGDYTATVTGTTPEPTALALLGLGALLALRRR